MEKSNTVQRSEVEADAKIRSRVETGREKIKRAEVEDEARVKVETDIKENMEKI